MITSNESLPQNISEQAVNKVIDERFELVESGLNSESLVSVINRAILKLQQPETKIVALYGGAASGKTTLCKALVDSLVQQGHSADFIGTDDYVIGDRAYRRQHIEGKDPREKYDFKLLNQTISAIKEITSSEETVGVPTYDEVSGEGIAAGEGNYTHRIGRLEALIVEGDFPEVENPDLVIYIDTPDEARLTNRLARDKVHRNEADTSKIVDNFHLRQKKQHEPITLTALDQANIIIRASVTENEWRYDVFHSQSPAPLKQ